MRRLIAYPILIACLAAAGCNESQSGANNLVLFTPDECDVVGSGCSFDDSMAAGGSTLVHIMGNDGVSTAGFDLESDDSSVLEVISVADVGGRPTWELFARSAGVAHLIAVDQNGDDVDFIEVAVQEIDNLALANFVGDAVGPDTSDPTYHEVWTVNADQNVSFHVLPQAGTGLLMGQVQYGIVIDAALEESMVEGADIPFGYFYFNAPAGDYEIEITADNGTPLDVLFEVR